MANKPMSQANLLRSMGIDNVLGKSNKTINPVGFLNKDKDKYSMIWTRYDLNQCCSRFVWENLPNGIQSWQIERMLYFRGAICGFSFASKFYILPFVQQGGLNPQGLPISVRPITYNGQAVDEKPTFFGENFTLPIDYQGNENEDYSAVLLYDNVPYSPTNHAPSLYFYNQVLIKDIADTLARVNINVVVSNTKIILQVKDGKQRDVVEKELWTAFGSDSPFAVVTSPLEANSIQSTSEFNADELFNTIKNYDSIRCFMSGISSKGFGAEKKERLVTGELAGAEEEKDLILDMAYDLRKMFCDQCNKKFGLNMSVKKRADSYKENQEYSTEINGQNQDTIQEMEKGV